MATVEIVQRCLDQDFSDLPEKAEQGILKKLELLAVSPEFGKPLTGEFAGLRRITYAQYRILYRYHKQSETVFVVMIGLRKGNEIDDVYLLARRLLHSGKLEGGVEQLKVTGEFSRQLLENVRENIERIKAQRAKKRGGA